MSKNVFVAKENKSEVVCVSKILKKSFKNDMKKITATISALKLHLKLNSSTESFHLIQFLNFPIFRYF